MMMITGLTVAGWMFVSSSTLMTTSSVCATTAVTCVTSTTSTRATTTTTTVNTLLYPKLNLSPNLMQVLLHPQQQQQRRGGATARSTATTTTTTPPPLHHQPLRSRIGTLQPKIQRKKRGSTAAVTTTTTAISGTGTATMTSEIFNLVKGIVGVGVLSLPAGIGQFGNHPSVLLPSVGLIVCMGILSGYGFAIIGKVCAYTNATSYRDAWAKSIHPSSSWIPAVSATGKTFLACLALSMVLADTFTGLLRYPTSMRTNVLLTITTLILLPLCWMKNLSALSPFSLLGVLGMGFTAIAMTIRYLDQSYSAAAAAAAAGVEGVYYSQIASHLQPNFGTAGWMSVFQPRSLILLCMLSTAYMAHFNAPKFYQELYNNTLPRFHTVVASSFGISILMIAYITSIGFLTFGNAASGLVLNNYSPHDVWMSASRVAVAVALVFSYPLAFQGCRDGIIDLIQLVTPLQRSPTTLNGLTILLLVVLTTLAATLKDVSFVLALGGGKLNFIFLCLNVVFCESSHVNVFSYCDLFPFYS
jgi:amino acid permease